MKSDGEAARLRERADCLFSIAFRAREHGQTAIAEELAQLASEALDQAADVEHCGTADNIRRGIG
jgi:hypothetical protein